MSDSLIQTAGQALSALDAASRRRRVRVLGSAQRPEQTLDGRPVRAFCSNDYLGLAADPRLAEAVMAALATSGVGAGAAHLINGHHAEHEALEQAVADFLRREAALLFSTGYMANIGVLQTLTDRHSVVFEDRLNHASLIDAARSQRARTERYRHADPADLEARLRARRPQRKAAERWIVATDGVFSMDGDLAPLPELAALCARYDAWLVVDDAHGFGVLGPRGGGTVDHFGLGAADVPLLVVTFGKALGSAGAAVVGDAVVVDWIRQRARTYVYTTAQPPALARATRTALAIVEAEPERRARVFDLVEHLAEGLVAAGFDARPSTTPIQPIFAPTARGEPNSADALALAWSQRLEAAGLLVPAIRSPTVPPGSARLRITLSAAHTRADVDALIEALRTTRPLR